MKFEQSPLFSRPWFFYSFARGISVFGIFFLLSFIGLNPAVSQVAEWQETKSDVANFSIQLPGVTQYEKDEVDTDYGKLGLHSFVVDADAGSTAYIIIFTEYPDGLFENKSPNQILNDSAKGAIGDGKVQSQEEIVHEGCDGRELAFTKAGAETQFVRWRLLLHKHNLYQIGVVSIGKEVDAEVFAHMCESFKLLKK